MWCVCVVCMCGVYVWCVCVVCVYEFVCGASSVTHTNTNTNTEHTHQEVINTNSRRNTCSCFTNRSSAPSAATFHSPTHPTRPLHTSLPPSPRWTHPCRVYFIVGKPLTVDISSDVKNLDQVIPGSTCQPVSIVIPFHTHHSSLEGMAKFRKDCVKVKVNSHMLSSRNIIAQFLAMTTCMHNAHGHTQNTAKWRWAP